MRLRKLQKEEDEKEINDLEAVCASLEKEGVEFAAERLEAIQHYLKDQFMEIFVELKQTLEVIISIWVRLHRGVLVLLSVFSFFKRGRGVRDVTPPFGVMSCRVAQS